MTDTPEDLSGVARLADRGVVRVAGEDARDFLQGLLTNDVASLEAGGRYAALLTPQGKILFDFLVAADSAGGFLLDCPAALVASLAKRLGFYRLRAKVTVEDLSAALVVMATWGPAGDEFAAALPPSGVRVRFPDPRSADLGERWIVDAAALDSLPPIADGAAAAYEARRIRFAIPKGGADFAYGETFPHEANLDRLHGLDFRKGCYVGQEVVSRVEHRGLARKRIVAVRFGGAAPPAGTAVLADSVALGVVGSSSGAEGLALLRLDRVEEARAAGTPVTAGETSLEVAQA